MRLKFDSICFILEYRSLKSILLSVFIDLGLDNFCIFVIDFNRKFEFMLLGLRIENYALIRELDVEFSSGLTVITGETGAGKSIMLGALGLVLGSRADVNVLWDKEKKCIVEAEFIIDINLKKEFEDNGLDFDTNSIFRREISPNGKSRAFINDTPVQLNIMRQIGEKIMDIHSQNSTQKLKETEFQYKIIDSFIKDKEIFKEYRRIYNRYNSLKSEIKELDEKIIENRKEKDYLEFLFQEFENLNLKIGEKQELEMELELISNSEEIKTNFSSSLISLDNENIGILNQLLQIRNNLSRIKNHHKSIEEFSNRIDSSYIELKDIFNEMENFNDNINFDSQRLEDISQRLDIIYSLEKKHGVEGEEELIKTKENIENKLLEDNSLEIKVEELKKEEKILYENLTRICEQLNNYREEAKDSLFRNIIPYFKNLGLENARLVANITNSKDFNYFGKNNIEFLFNANKGGVEQEISKVISGGELSRLMLAIKALEAENKSENEKNLTLIFDEIDTGVSGDIASKVGEIMRKISEKFQILSITHLPQIAAKGNNHFKVKKDTVNNNTVSTMVLLNNDERVEELAIMLSGDIISQAAILNARELLS